MKLGQAQLRDGDLDLRLELHIRLDLQPQGLEV